MESPRPGSESSLLDSFPSEQPDVSPSEQPDVKPPSGEVRLRKKNRRDPNRPLDPWERYRALNDAMDEAYELMDHSNREARFALLVMGILNAFVVIGATRSEVAGSLDRTQRIGAAVMLGIYAVTAIYFLFQAIAALRPGQVKADLSAWRESGPDYPRGVRYYEDVIQRDAHSHWQAWSDIAIARLNAELAVQHHSLCVRSHVKRVALARLFAGLRIMTILVVGLMALFVAAVWVKVGWVG